MEVPGIDVAISDNNPLMLSALSGFVTKDRRFSLVATASTAEGFLEAVFRVPVEVGVIDWYMPEIGSEKIIQILREHENAPRIVVYAQGDAQEISRRAMAAGAAGFCSRNNTPAELMDIIASVAAGKMVFPFLDVRDLRADPIHQLTRTERLFLVSLAKGSSNNEIAVEHNVSINTVKFHLRNIYEKLSIKNRAQAVAFYYSALSRDGNLPDE